MNMGPSEAMRLVRALKVKFVAANGVEIGVCPPALSIPAVMDLLKGSSCTIGVGGQNMEAELSGAFTGEISAPMLVDAGCKYVIVGHSERRQLFGETDAGVFEKTKVALAHDLVPIVCVGETLEERESNRTEAVIESQLEGSLGGLSADQMSKIIIAYEPVWAIGTGKTATTEQASAVHAFIRDWMSKKFSPEVAEVVRIQYGGSVKPGNAAELLSQVDIDGALVGGASLKPDDFEAIVKAAPGATF